ADAVFDSTFTEFAKIRTPARVFLEIVRHTFGEKDVPGIAAIHYALRHIDPGTGNIRPIINIPDSVDRAAVNAHPHFKFWIIQQCFADLQGATHRSLDGIEKHQSNAVAPW